MSDLTTRETSMLTSSAAEGSLAHANVLELARTIQALRAELAQVRQERDEAQRAAGAYGTPSARELLDATLTRAEQAEAEVQRLRARLAEVHDRLGEQV